MPWLLDTPLDAGSMDPNAPGGEYTHCRLQLEENDPDAQAIYVSISYGWLSFGAYVAGALMPTDKVSSHTIRGSDWVNLVADHTPLPGEKTYAAARRGLYEELVDKGIIPPGSVDP